MLQSMLGKIIEDLSDDLIVTYRASSILISQSSSKYSIPLGIVWHGVDSIRIMTYRDDIYQDILFTNDPDLLKKLRYIILTTKKLRMEQCAGLVIW